MASNTSITVLKKRVGLLLVFLWIVFAGLYFFIPRLSKGNDKKANNLAKSFAYAYADLVSEKKANIIFYEVKNWRYEKEHYEISVKMEYPGGTTVLLNEPDQCKAVVTYSFTLNENEKLVHFKRLNGNACALKLEATEATRNALKDISKLQSQMKKYTRNQHVK